MLVMAVRSKLLSLLELPDDVEADEEEAAVEAVGDTGIRCLAGACMCRSESLSESESESIR
jgi:hypothetical protein